MPISVQTHYWAEWLRNAKFRQGISERRKRLIKIAPWTVLANGLIIQAKNDEGMTALQYLQRFDNRLALRDTLLAHQ